MIHNYFYLYTFLDPRKPGKYTYNNIDICFLFEPFYIGKGSYNRINEHFNTSSLYRKNIKNVRINLIQNEGYEVMKIILYDNLIENISFEYEKLYINKIGRSNLNKGPLTNMTYGGDGQSGVKLNERFKEKIHPERMNINKEILYQKYIIENLSLNKCAIIFNVNKRDIFNMIKLYGFKKKESNIKLLLSTKEKKPIIQYDLNGNFIKEWESSSIAAKELNFDSSHITKCSKGKLKSCKGFIWKYKEDDINIYIKSEKISKQEIIDKRRKIYQYDLDGCFIKEYSCISTAVQETKILTISTCCRGKRNKAGEYIFSYEKKDKINPYYNKVEKLIFQYDLDGSFIQEFKSIAEAARKTNSNKSGINDTCKGKFKQSNNFIW